LFGEEERDFSHSLSLPTIFGLVKRNRIFLTTSPSQLYFVWIRGTGFFSLPLPANYIWFGEEEQDFSHSLSQPTIFGLEKRNGIFLTSSPSQLYLVW
jgi:hypothetical protein